MVDAITSLGLGGAMPPSKITGNLFESVSTPYIYSIFFCFVFFFFVFLF